ncbi:Ig-like domain-containing protein [Aliifodinibius sp. S!AR15-10]|uniref:Ig-like domain-containing protein n=1 Tax=Aliifodinibius sp. S!AR15-10 TaxID=2950437 RepID=UPI00285F5BF3|nr:Ig-like domain-containing protein [Aliifodinibius sp. S!AR15-10]MDR8391849.1 Ig-like domain-containing protein [Aliifodinibius sp. S!AR15-10]
MNFFSTEILLICGLLVLVSGCATPTSPSGGPRDEEGPKIINIVPESGTTNFSESQIELSFSEFVERSSLGQAVIIEPDIGLDYSLDWGRKSVAIEFDRELPDSTTIIVTIGTELSDTNGNEMTEPRRIAVSTGPEIDEGEIKGRVVDAQTGKGTSGDRVLLYQTPVDLTQKADYLAQTDTSGRFNFTYLSPGNYKVFWVADQNRSKIWEQERERAQPFYRETIMLEKAGKDSLGTIYKAGSDTTKPKIQGVGLFSSRRLRLRFSENIELTDSSAIAINDTLGNSYAEAATLYIQPNERYVLFARSGKNLNPQETYQLVARNIRDLADNVRSKASYRFEGSAQEDTTQQRIISQENQDGIYPDEPLEIVYAKPITEQAIRDSLYVVRGDSLIQKWEHLETDQNRLRVRAGGNWEQGLDYEIQVWNPITASRKSYPLNVWHPADYGSIAFAMTDTTDHQPYHLSLTTEERGNMIDTTFTDSVEIKDLPPLQYKVIIYGDRNNNQRWDAGQVQPFREPEPYFIQQNIPVKKGFASEVSVSFE